ncbi:sulfite exporter TauE/SafE family protein [Salinibacter sp.]|uniref:sulfite exporter TauE/SafE family protein n=1 Tax=Salinibacter sp. TaxID=2065818 RepID=UPI0021E70484|nr:sulfite exporter TauE/SafE family protein [Salinibacter sp.]
MSVEFWYMLPIGIAIATVAMASGVGGATFFSPLFILGLGLSPELAVGAGLVVEVFGFGSGVYAYVRRQLIDYRVGGMLLAATVPAAVAGVVIAHFADADILKVILGMGLFAVAVSFLRAPDDEMEATLENMAHEDPDEAETCLVTAEDEEICYTVCNTTEGRLISGIGGLFVGMVSSGLGELNGYFLLQRCRVPSSVAVATSVFVVAITALIASVGHIFQVAQGGLTGLATMGRLLLFTVPGVVIGAQLGPELARRVPDRVMEIGLGGLFTITAGLLLFEAGLH